MEIQQDFKELLELFNAHKVEYLIVGGYALAFHGAPRFTGDIDLLVQSDSENAARILEALKEYGFGSLKLSEVDFTSPNNVVQLGVPPVRVDIMTSLTAVDWEQARAGRNLEQAEEWEEVEEVEWVEIAKALGARVLGQVETAYVLPVARRYLTNRVSPAIVLPVPNVGIRWLRSRRVLTAR